MLFIKLAMMSQRLLNFLYLTFLFLKNLIVHGIFLAQSVYIQKELKKIEAYKVMHAEGAARLRGRIYIS